MNKKKCIKCLKKAEKTKSTKHLNKHKYQLKKLQALQIAKNELAKSKLIKKGELNQ